MAAFFDEFNNAFIFFPENRTGYIYQLSSRR